MAFLYAFGAKWSFDARPFDGFRVGLLACRGEQLPEERRVVEEDFAADREHCVLGLGMGVPQNKCVATSQDCVTLPE